MKNLVFISLIFSLILASCSKEEDDAVSSNGYTAKIDNKFWRSKTTQASIFNGTIVVVGQASDGSRITFSLSGDTVGTYVVDDESSSSVSYIVGPGGKNFTSGGNSAAGGEVVIESISLTDKRMSGSIICDVVRASGDSTITITQGKFTNIKYQNLPLGLSSNELSVKLNGTAWSPQNVSGFVAFKTIFLNAIDADGTRQLSFELPEMIGPGKYELNYFTNYKAIYNSISGKKYYATNGTLEIVSHNLVKKELEATFNITAEAHEGGGIFKFTEGSFLIVYE